MKIKNLVVLAFIALMLGFSSAYLLGGKPSGEADGLGGTGSVQVIESPDSNRSKNSGSTVQENKTSNNALKTNPAEPEIIKLAAGTRSETPLYIISGIEQGPSMLVLGGVHGDEPAAFWSGNMAARLRIQKGTLYVIPHFNVIAQSQGTRTGIGDINRKFPGNPDSTDSESRLCYEVSSLVREKGIKYVLTFHEAIDFKRVSANPGQTLYYDWEINPYANTNLKQEADSLIAKVNEKIKLLPGFRDVELFSSYIDPIPTSATFVLMKECGVSYAFGCEVAKNNDEHRRVWFHLAFLVNWMEMKGFTVLNWSEVESQIWSGNFKTLI